MDDQSGQTPPPASTAPVPAPYVADSGKKGGLPIKKIISLLIGLAVVVSVIFVAIFVVLPRLSTKSDEDVTLTYWLTFEDPAPFESIAADFHRLNPHIKVNVEKQDVKALGNYAERLATRINNKTGPDIIRYHNSWANELRPFLLPLPEEVVKSTNLDTKFYPVVAADLKKNGAYYGVPIHFDTLALFINTQLFKNVGVDTYPSTWEDFYPTALKLTVKDSTGKITQSGAALGTFDNITHASDILSMLFIQNGADINDLANSEKQASDALDFYTSFAKGDSKVWDDSLDNSTLAFGKGNLAMYIGYSWDIFQLKAINPNLSFIVMSVPHEQERRSSIASYWVEGVSAKTPHPKEAFEFLQFLASKENMEKLYAQEAKARGFGDLYPRSDLAPLLKDNPLIYPFVQQGPDAKSTIFSSDTHDDANVDALVGYMGDAVRGVISGSKSPQSAIETLVSGVAQKLNPNGATKQQ